MMPVEQLIEAVEASAQEKIKELMERATKEAAEIKQEAERTGETIKSRLLEAAKKKVEMEGFKSLAKSREETRMQLIRVKDEMYKNAFFEAQKILLSARGNTTYEKVFRNMLKEVVLELEGEEIQLHIDKRDENLCGTLLLELNSNCEIIADLTCSGGLDASTKDGRFIVFNTIEKRLEKAKGVLRPEIFSILYGGQGGV
jgi:vacuolar-type H+-ATPase subunit E/Vma4